MKPKKITFDQVFLLWMEAESQREQGPNYLQVAKAKGFNSNTEWRLATALRLGLDHKEWVLEEISDPGIELPNFIVGPYQGWSLFFKNKLQTSFKEAVEIPAFFEWCNQHDRIIPIMKNFPLPSNVIALRKSDGKLIHIEGGHRICAVAYANKTGHPIIFKGQPPVLVATADISDEELEDLRKFLELGTNKPD